MGLLLHLNGVDEDRWAARLQEKLGDYPVLRRDSSFNAGSVDYIFVWKPDDRAFDGLDNLKAVLSLGAGVDALVQHKGLPRSVPLVRYVDDELTQCMSEYVVAHVLMHHRLYSKYQSEQQARSWSQLYPPPAWKINVGVMGLGVLGQDAIAHLKPLGFNVRGWGRSAREIDGIQTFAGTEGFDSFLADTDILVNLLPLTPETKGILNHDNFRKLRRGALHGGPAIINAARGGHQVETDIVKALIDGTLGAASLDVFEVEPLPKESPLWALENCYITPHIAAISNPETGVDYFANMILGHEAGASLRNVVDLARGY